MGLVPSPSPSSEVVVPALVVLVLVAVAIAVRTRDIVCTYVLGSKFSPLFDMPRTLHKQGKFSGDAVFWNLQISLASFSLSSF